jgi:hypothetical protein
VIRREEAVTAPSFLAKAPEEESRESGGRASQREPARPSEDAGAPPAAQAPAAQAE